MNIDLEPRESQMRKGNLKLVVMALLMNEGEKYGLDIIACLKDEFAIDIVERAIMTRLQEDWVNSC